MDTDPDLFRSIEKEHSLFYIRIDDIPVWEMIRHSVWKEIKQQTFGGRAFSDVEMKHANFIKAGSLFLKNLIRKNPFLSDETEIMFYGHPRRKKEVDGLWWDIYCDPIHVNCDYDYIHFETTHNLRHYDPARTNNLRYLDLIQYGSAIQRKVLGIEGSPIPSPIQTQLENTETAISDQFNADVNLTERVRQKLDLIKTKLWMYRRLLERVNPSCVVIIVSYGSEILIKACKEKNIPVVELQHGIINQSHFGYSYRGFRTKEMFPDYLLLWGEFWKNTVEYPIPDERIMSVGYPYLEQSFEKYNSPTSDKQILFLSQGPIGKKLSKFALAVENNPDINKSIVYKLHPGEYARWRDEYPWLVETNIDVIDDSGPSLYQLFSDSSVQIGVYSTAIYEGLYYELETYLYDCPGINTVQPLIDKAAVDVVSSAGELEALLGQSSKKINRERFFEPNATENVCRVLKKLASK